MNRITALLCKPAIVIIFFLTVSAATAHAQTALNAFAGKSYNIFIYGTGVSNPAVTISFKENLTLLIDKYNGVGAYIPVGTAFAGGFSTPDYNKKNMMLVLFFAGFTVGDFIAGTGSSFLDFQFEEFIFFLGYLE